MVSVLERVDCIVMSTPRGTGQWLWIGSGMNYLASPNVFQCLQWFSAHPVALYKPLSLRLVIVTGQSEVLFKEQSPEVQFLINRISNKV